MKRCLVSTASQRACLFCVAPASKDLASPRKKPAPALPSAGHRSNDHHRATRRRRGADVTAAPHRERVKLGGACGRATRHPARRWSACSPCLSVVVPWKTNTREERTHGRARKRSRHSIGHHHPAVSIAATSLSGHWLSPAAALVAATMLQLPLQAKPMAMAIVLAHGGGPTTAPLGNTGNEPITMRRPFAHWASSKTFRKWSKERTRNRSYRQVLSRKFARLRRPSGFRGAKAN